MKALYNLELQIQKKYFKNTIFAICLVVGINLFNREFSLIYLAPILLALFSSFSAAEVIEREKINITLFSAGIKRDKLIKMKYTISFIYLVLASILSWLLYMLLKNIVDLNANSICINFSVALIYISIFLTISFIVGSKYRFALNIFIIMFIVASIILINSSDFDLNNSKLGAIVVPVAILVYVFLYYFTKMLYRRKDVG